MDGPWAEIQEGKLRGITKQTIEGENIHCFLGIPYAKPPIAKLRFRPAEPVEPWTGIRNATKDGNYCYQQNYYTLEFSGSEDCLYLNVFTKNLLHEDSKLKPVMVWIHGGGFVEGSNDSNFYGPEHLLTEDVVLVSINYRLGVLGFLCLRDASLNVPGNNGLKDQVAALKWVQRNIKNFNGDPNNVTIFGESSGATSVNYLVLSPLTKGLFHKAVIQSGSSLNILARAEFDVMGFMKYIKKEVETQKEALEILEQISGEDLVRWQFEYSEDQNDILDLGVVGPVIEEDHDGAFISKHPIEILKLGQYNKVPVMIGYCSNEGLIFELADKIKNRMTKYPLKYFIPREMRLLSEDSVNTICKKIEQFYFTGDNTEDPYMLQSDGILLSGIWVSALNISKNSGQPVYFYRYSLDIFSHTKNAFNLEHIPGACHADELQYLFHNSKEPILDKLDKRHIKKMVKLWTNFAKYSDPTPNEKEFGLKWELLDSNDVKLLDIGRDLVFGINPEEHRMLFWREIFQMCPFTEQYLNF